MIKINLLPKEFEKKAAAQQKIVLISAAVVVVLSIFVGGYFLKVTKLASLTKKIAEVEKELGKLKPVVQKVNDIESKKNTLNKKIEVMQNLMESRIVYPVLMERLAALLPPKVWITSLNTKMISGGLSLNMGVLASDNYGVADFLSVLEETKEFQETKFTGIATVAGEAGDIRSFNIDCNYYTAGEAPKKESKPAKKSKKKKRRR